jgi:hypothetical protein
MQGCEDKKRVGMVATVEKLRKIVFLTRDSLQPNADDSAQKNCAIFDEIFEIALKEEKTIFSKDGC